MKNVTALLIVLAMVSVGTFATVTVDYMVNTSTIQGCTDSTHQIQICGSEVGPEGVDHWYNFFLTWGDDSPLATNIGGDYWKLSIEYPDSMIGWRMAYKIRYKSLDDDGFTWENYPPGNRMYVLPASDTTLAVAYPDNEYNPPYTPSDSVDIFVRVNMVAYEDNFDLLSIVGHYPMCDPAWSPGSIPLTQEGTSDYWSTTIRIPQGVIDTVDQIDPLGGHPGTLMYRFAIGNDWSNTENLNGKYWDGNENRIIVLHQGLKDTTLAWKYWNDIPPAGFTTEDTTDITFYTDMTKAIANKGFEIGDTLLVRLGYFNSSTSVLTDTLVRQSGTQNYFVTVNDVPVIFGEPLYYQYYLVKRGVEQREVYFNFDYTGDVASEAERRAYVPTSATETIQDIVDSKVDARRAPIFRNNELLSQDVTLTIECDLRPAIYQLLAGSTLEGLQGTQSITPAMIEENPDTVFALGLYINGPLSNNAEGTWASWGGTLAADTNRVMYDDGTHGDAVAGDTIYTLIYHLSPDSGHTVGQEFKFGIGGSDNESGYGLNHIENIDDTNPTFTLHTQWGSINPNFYNAWNYDTQSPVLTAIDDDNVVIKNYKLNQNYPNPFNPTTQISFEMPERSIVRLEVYNILGQKVRTLVSNELNAGLHTCEWNGLNDAGQRLSAGVYVYQLKAGDFTQTKKMLLLK